MKSFQKVLLAFVFTAAAMAGLTIASIPAIAYPQMDGLSQTFWTPPGGMLAFDPTTGSWRPVALSPNGSLFGAATVYDVDLLVTNVPSSWTVSASGTDISFFNLGTNTVWASFNDSGATISHDIPIVASGSLSRDIAPGNVIWLVAPAGTVVHVAEGRR